MALAAEVRSLAAEGWPFRASATGLVVPADAMRTFGHTLTLQMGDTMIDARACVRCLVAGRVQGVFFRASIRNLAERLGISGSARNLPDGRVEVVACGRPEAVVQLREWLRKGPPGARVTGLSCELLPDLGSQGFMTD